MPPAGRMKTEIWGGAAFSARAYPSPGVGAKVYRPSCPGAKAVVSKASPSVVSAAVQAQLTGTSTVSPAAVVAERVGGRARAAVPSMLPAL